MVASLFLILAGISGAVVEMVSVLKGISSFSSFFFVDSSLLFLGHWS